MKPLHLLLSAFLAIAPGIYQTAFAVEPSPAATIMSGDFVAETEDREHESERKEIQSLLDVIENQWNTHDTKALMANYADDYINNDGLDKKAVQKLTEEFWKTYPDAKSGSKTKDIRIEGNYATIESRDTAVGTTEMPDMSFKGELQSVSEGQLYMKRLGNVWRIIGDRIDYEKVRVSFGLAKHLNASFSAPEQVKAGKQFSAKLEVTLPPGLNAMGSITNQPLKFPQPSPQEKPRQLEQPPVLERVMSTNQDNHNELLTATVILVDPNHKIMGFTFLTKRLNVVPDGMDVKDESIATQESTSSKVASESTSDKDKNSKDSSNLKDQKDQKSESNADAAKAAETASKAADTKAADTKAADTKAADSKAADTSNKSGSDKPDSDSSQPSK